MAFNAGQLISTLTLQFNQFSAGLRTAVSAARTAGAQMQSQFNTTGAGANAATASVNNLGMGFKDLGKMISGIVISQIFYQAITDIRQATMAVADFSMEMERAQMSFTRMLGSSEAASGFINNMKDFAVVSEFSTTQVIELSRRLLAVGFEATQVGSVMKIVGDEVSYLGGGADKFDRIVYALSQLNQMSTVSKRQINQLAMAGVSVNKYLEKGLGLTKDQVANIGKEGIKTSSAIKAILRGMQEDSKGMTKIMAESTTGMLMTIKDSFLIVASEMSKGLFGVASKYIRKIRDIIEAVRSAIRQGGIGGMLDSLFPPTVANNIRLVIGAIKQFGTAIQMLLVMMQPIVMMIGGGLLQALAVVLPILSRLAYIIVWVAQAALATYPALQYLVAAFLGLLVVNVISRFMLFFFGVLRLGAIIGFVANMCRNLSIAIKGIYLALTAHPLVLLITLLAAALMYAAYSAGYFEGILGKLNSMVKKFTGIDTSKIAQKTDMSKVNEQMKKYQDNLKDIKSLTDDTADATDGTGKAADKAKKKVDKFIAAFDEVFQVPEKLDEANDAMKGPDLGDIGNIGDLGDAIDDATNGGDGFDVPINFDIPPIVMPPMPGFSGMLDSVAEAIQGAFQHAFESVEGWLKDLLGKLKDAAQPVRDSLGNMVPKGVLDGFQQQVQDVWDSLKDLAGGLTAIAKNWFIHVTIPTFKAVLAGIGELAKSLKELMWNNAAKGAALLGAAFLILKPRVTAALGALKLIGSLTFGTVFDALAYPIKMLKKSFESIDWNSIGKTLSNGVSSAWNTITEFFKNIDWGKIGTSLAKGLAGAKDKILEALKGIGQFVVDSLPGILAMAILAILTRGAILKVAPAAAKSSGAGLTDSLKIKSVDGKPMNKELDPLGDVINQVKLDEAKKAIEKFTNDVRTTISNWGKDITTSISGTWNNVTSSISNAWSNIWNTISTHANNIWNTLSGWGNNILTTMKNTWNSVTNNISSAWANIRNTLSNAVNSIWGTLSGWGNNVRSFFSGVWSGVQSIFSNFRANIISVWSGLMGSLKSIMNSIIRYVNTAINGLNKLNFTIPKPLPGAGTKIGLHIPNIPYLASGGIVTQETLAVMGEGGRKEAVIPLDNSAILKPFINQIASEIKRILGQGSTSFNQQPVTLTIGTLIGDSRSYAELERRLSNIRINENIRRGS